jgi:hypothetical protein
MKVSTSTNFFALITAILSPLVTSHPSIPPTDEAPPPVDLTTLPGFPGLINGAMPNGSYSVIYNDANTATAVQYRPFDASVVSTFAAARAENHQHQARDANTKTKLLPRNSVGCDDISLDSWDTDLVTYSLETDCGNELKSNHYVISGDVVAFFCRWHESSRCTKSSAQWAWGYITNYCNYYRAGSVSDALEEDRTWSYGYTNWRKHHWCNTKAGDARK